MKWLDQLSVWASQPAIPNVGITKGMFKSIKELQPGQVMRFSTRDGSEFILLPADDFDHIASLAGIGFAHITDKSKA